MVPSQEPPATAASPCTPDEGGLDELSPSAEKAPSIEQACLPAIELPASPAIDGDDPLWQEYILQQQRLSCPGCGEGGPVY